MGLRFALLLYITERAFVGASVSATTITKLSHHERRPDYGWKGDEDGRVNLTWPFSLAPCVVGTSLRVLAYLVCKICGVVRDHILFCVGIRII
ncbi:Protein of unknown function [Pyronema omphalodes CBS 100304]|uniref:Secreted protein n=1 Tax=Pyronema omphalodes (strain CBS 100304) TaxID=1076935 RepID=U4LC70_PYROM|nr:Protein of unknown function [Pyronema omphalodes CBS 100304]